MILRIIFLILLFCSPAFGDPVSSVNLPLSIKHGGNGASGIVTTNSSSGAINNCSIPTNTIIFTGAAVGLTGLVSDGTPRIITLINYTNTGSSIPIYNESSASSANNRFNSAGGYLRYIPFGTSIQVIYDTVNSRWRLYGLMLGTSSPIYVDLYGNIGCSVASSGTTGCLSGTDYTSFSNSLVWTKTGTDIYNNNTGKVFVGTLDCSLLASYAACTANVSTGCSRVYGGDCHVYDGNQTTCEAAAGGTCSWDSGTNLCNGTYYTSCYGHYRADDGSSAIFQSHSFTACTGTATACSIANCTNYGCGPLQSNTCPSQVDESSCTSVACSWGGHSCSGDNSHGNTCPGYGDSTSCDAAPPCSSAYADCSTATYPDCTGYPGCSDGGDHCDGTYFSSCGGDNSASNTCPDYNEDPGGCVGVGCTYVPDSCSGDNSYCPGTVTPCNVLTQVQCPSQSGCSLTTTPAGNFSGDVVVTTDGYLQAAKNGAGAPSSGDCDAAHIGRIYVRTGTTKLYICLGAGGWLSTTLS